MKKFFFFLIALAIISFTQTKATIKTYGWAENFRGYSIEEVPGSNPTEYVAVGTLYDRPLPGDCGLHFLYLDAAGQVIHSRKSWVNTGSTHNVSCRVVDVVAESANDFWITLQVTDRSSSQDYIYPIRVDNFGVVNTTSGWPIQIKQGLTQWQSIYPTHSLFYNSELYICGYIADGTNNDIPPDNYTTPKQGIVLSIGIHGNNCLGVTGGHIWNTPDNGLYDYDMPLRMRLDNNNNILITGAMNSDPNHVASMSAILVLRIDPNTMLPIDKNGLFIPGGPMWGPNPPSNGLYGVDIYQHPITNDVYVLSNYYEHSTIYRWGIAMLNPNLTAPTPASYMGINTIFRKPVDWAKQFFPLDNSSSDISFAVVGENVDLYKTCGAALPSRVPSIINVNPFVANFDINGTSITGITGATRTSHHIQLSNYKTQASSLDYFNGTSVGSLEDVTRLFTFATRESNNGNIAIMTPLTHGSLTKLNSKLIVTNSSGVETSCNDTYTDCDPGVFISNVADCGTFEDSYLDDDLYGGFYFDDVFDEVHNEYNCSSGIYKSTRVANITNVETSLYPNPTKEVLNIRLPNQATATDDFSFILTNLEGKEVFRSSKFEAGDAIIRIQLPALPSGVYIGKTNYNGKSRIERITIL